MMHYRPERGSFPGDGPGAAPRRRELLVIFEVSLSQMHAAKRAADESLRRAQDAPGPHVTTNPIFVALYEAHLRDREALFEAMRRLDAAQEALRAIAA